MTSVTTYSRQWSGHAVHENKGDFSLHRLIGFDSVRVGVRVGLQVEANIILSGFKASGAGKRDHTALDVEAYQPSGVGVKQPEW